MLTIDNNQDGIPERYLHMKNIAISGVFDGDTSANVLITGSPNWSANAQKSDEILFRITKATKMVRQYHGEHRPALLRPVVAPERATDGGSGR